MTDAMELTDIPVRRRKEKKKRKDKINNIDSIEQSECTVKAVFNEKTNVKKDKSENKKKKRKKRSEVEDTNNSTPDVDLLTEENEVQIPNGCGEAVKAVEIGRAKKLNGKKKRAMNSSKSKKKRIQAEEDEVYQISSGDDDSSKGMKKWVTDYYTSRPGFTELLTRIDDFINSHEARLEQERKDKEAKAAEGGWTVVVHHKGRKKTVDSESGIAVGSVAQAALEDQMAKKKLKPSGAQDFYRFQKREAHRNEIVALQSKFEQDKKRIQQLRAARKFKPY